LALNERLHCAFLQHWKSFVFEKNYRKLASVIFCIVYYRKVLLLKKKICKQIHKNYKQIKRKSLLS
jgi:hypothetical protein